MGVDKFTKKLKGKKKVVWTTGTQFDFYDNKAKVKESVKHVVAFFKGL